MSYHLLPPRVYSRRNWIRSGIARTQTTHSTYRQLKKRFNYCATCPPQARFYPFTNHKGARYLNLSCYNIPLAFFRSPLGIMLGCPILSERLLINTFLWLKNDVNQVMSFLLRQNKTYYGITTDCCRTPCFARYLFHNWFFSLPTSLSTSALENAIYLHTMACSNLRVFPEGHCFIVALSRRGAAEQYADFLFP